MKETSSFVAITKGTLKIVLVSFSSFSILGVLITKDEKSHFLSFIKSSASR
ncbi:hypothetical protein [Aliarcobacter butzleri]|uniref:hypothetical protein n=1 Tax=Aliarcobacter butzleri TaxID=28197 RepID=UPI0036F44325